MTERTEILVKLALTAIALGALVWRRRHRGSEDGRAGWLLACLAVVSMAAFTGFFAFHQGRFTHFGENFHYQLGSKYFPELGYDGLYDASIAAQEESDPGLPLPATVRDLRTNSIVPVASLAAHRDEVRKRFSAERWRGFVRDHRYFLDRYTLPKLDEIRLDHGYNPPPTWTFVARLFNSRLPIDATTIPLMALLDWVLVGMALVVVRRTYGTAVTAAFAILFGLGYPWGYTWVGGAFLRYDWFAAVVVGICMLARKRHATAGALLAYATAVRIFPVLLLAGIGVGAIRDLVARRDPRWIVRFAAGFAGCLGACALAGCLTGRGPAAWGEFVRDIRKHHGTWTTNTAGLELVFLYNSETMVTNLPADWPLPRRWAVWQAAMNRVAAERRPFYLGLAGLLVAAALAAAWRRPADEAAVLGVAVVFALLVLSCYYWVVLTLLALRRGAAGTLGLLGLNALVLVVAGATSDTQVTYLVVSLGLAALFAAVLAPDVVAILRPRLRAAGSKAAAC